MNYVEEAEKIAKKMGCMRVESFHVVLAILKNNEDITKMLGITEDDYRKECLEYVGDSGTCFKGELKYDKLVRMLVRDNNTTDPYKIIDILNDKNAIAVEMLYQIDADADALFNYIHKDDLPRSLLGNDYLINLNRKVEEQDIHIFGMREQCDELINNLFRVRKPNVILVGKAGCGKSALVECLAERINRGDVPEFMKDKIIFEMVVPNAVAGTRYRGDFEERIKNILKDAQNCPRVVLFIDEFHMVMTAGGAEGAVDLANILKPYLARGEISLIGATTTEEYEIIKKDKAMQRRFTLMQLEKPSDEEIRLILKGWAPRLEAHYHVVIDDELISDIIRQCKRERLKNSPDRELDALEKWCLEHCNWRAVDWEMATNG